MRRMTQADWRVVHTCLSMIAAGDWDEGSYGERPDIEATAAKVAERVKDDDE